MFKKLKVERKLFRAETDRKRIILEFFLSRLCLISFNKIKVDNILIVLQKFNIHPSYQMQPLEFNLSSYES